MTHRELKFDILRLLQNSKLVDDSRLSQRHIGAKIHQYRADGIQKRYELKGEIEPIWLQNLGTPAVKTRTTTTSTVAATTSSETARKIPITIETITTPAKSYVEFTKINSADDPLVQGCDCILGKLRIPEIVSLPGSKGSTHDKGIYRVSMASRQIPYHPTTINRFYGFVHGSHRSMQNYYWKIGNDLYIHPYKKKGNIILILDNPLDAGITQDDPYPISYTLVEFIIMKLLTQDFNIEAKMAADAKNDAADTMIAMQQKLRSYNEDR